MILVDYARVLIRKPPAWKSRYCNRTCQEHFLTLRAATNYAASLVLLKRFEEAKSLLRETIPVTRRVFGDSKEITLTMRKLYATTLCSDLSGATIDDLREALNTLEEIEPTTRRVLGSAHPDVAGIETACIAREPCSAPAARTRKEAYQNLLEPQITPHY